MIEQITLEESLEKATAYMLRNDGLIFKNELMHPYIIYNKEDTTLNSLKRLLTKDRWMIVWFYIHSRYDDTKKLIEELIKSLVKSEVEYIEKDWAEEHFSFNEKTNYSTKEVDYLELFEDINNRTNQEFLRIRTSNLKFGGDSGDLYCRVSSNNFNWYNLLSELIIKNKNFIETITITNDPQSTGGKLKTYIIGNKKIDHMNADDFLFIKGNPVVENYKQNEILNEAIKSFNKGESFENTFFGIHPKYINGYFNILNRDWIKNNYE